MRETQFIRKHGTPEAEAVKPLHFRTYSGRQQLMATPMTRVEYNALRDWSMPANETDEPGYLTYIPGTKPNVPGMKGHSSWAVKEIFEATYRIYDSFIDRLRVERDELKDKIEKLRIFSTTDGYQTLNQAHQHLLTQQFKTMCDYLNILEIRIGLLS